MAILSVQKVCKSFDTKEVLNDASFTLNKGELVCILGLSGSGKTTLFNIIAGLEKPDSGKVFLENEDITGQSGKVSYMLQKDLLFPYYTILDNAILPLVIGGMKKEDAQKKAIPLFADFGIDGTQNQYPSELSGGMRQRAALLRTYLFSSDIMLLDEPFSALDMITKQSLHKWYLEMIQKLDTSTVFITHDIDEAILLSDRILIIGGTPGTIQREIVVKEPKPRSNDFSFSPDFVQLKKEICEELKI